MKRFLRKVVFTIHVHEESPRQEECEPHKEFVFIFIFFVPEEINSYLQLQYAYKMDVGYWIS